MTPSEIRRLDQTCQYATFRVDDLLLGIEVLAVQEVLRFQEMTPVPLAPDAVEGLINLRGQIVVALDLRRSLGLPERSDGSRPMNIVIHSGDGAVSLLVDAIEDVIRVPLEGRAAVPDTVPEPRRGLLSGVYTLESGMMLVVDTEQVLARARQPAEKTGCRQAPED